MAAEKLQLDDPWFWTVDRVIHYLCYVQEAPSDRPHAQFPETQSLEKHLHKEKIDGATLLSYIDRRALQEILGISAFGELSTVLDVISALRLRSLTYQRRQPATISTTAPTSEHSFRPVHSIGRSGKTELPGQGSDGRGPSRQNERFVVDDKGCKRRKLSLRAPISQTSEKSLSLPIHSNESVDQSSPHVIGEEIGGQNGNGQSDELSEGLSDQSTTSSSEEDSYAYLAHYHDQPDDEVLPLYGESEYGDDELRSLEEELQEEVLEDATKRDKLTQVEADEVVNCEISKYEELWRLKKLPAREATAWRTWRKGSSPAARQNLCNLSQTRLQDLEYRLSRFRTEILADEWKHATDLRKQCLSLQETINERLDIQQQVDVWKMPQEPKKPAKQVRLVKKSRRPDAKLADDEASVNLSSDEELLVGDHPSDEGEHIPVLDAERQSLPASDDDLEIERHNIGQDDFELEARKRWRAQASEFGADPLKSSNQEISEWTLDMLDYVNNGKRIVMKILWDSEDSNLGDLRKMLEEQDESELFGLVEIAFETLTEKYEMILGYNASETALAMMLARLFLSWCLCKTWAFRISSEELLKLAATEAGAIKRLVLTVQKNTPDLRNSFSECLQFIKAGLKEKERRRMQALNPVTIELSSDESDDEDLVRGATLGPQPDDDCVEIPRPITQPKVPRARAVMRDPLARSKRREAQRRLHEYEVRAPRILDIARKRLDYKEGQIIANPGKSDDEPFIYINDHIAKKIQAHQVEGVRFMWLSVASTDRGENVPGCLLAHSMGLGKTMQAIALICTLVEAAASSNEAVRKQVPPDLRTLKVLVLCPLGLVANWEQEIKTWIPPSTRKLIGSVVTYDDNLNTFYQQVQQWSVQGGLLLLGYDRFRTLMQQSKLAKSALPIHDNLKKTLAESPNLIIADEAHKLKSATTGIRRAAELIRSRVRVAMTGSPLSNNLSEYYELISWCCPGYMGSAIEFKAHYEEPIAAGHTVESTEGEKRRALRAIKMLEQECAPKVHRRDRDVLNYKLKPKHEFILTVPLTECQRALYNSYVEFMRETTYGQVGIGFLAKMDVLGRICGHPDIFKHTNFWVDLAKISNQVGSSIQTISTHGTPTSTSREGVGISAQDLLMDAAKYLALRNKMNNITTSLRVPRRDFDLSYRTKILMQILQESIALKDQILVFSHSVVTLEWLINCIKAAGISALLLTGDVPAATRVQLIDEFNKGSHSVALLSTKAGALGFNIVGANRAIIFDFDYNPQWEIQAVSRLWRIGQQKEVYIYRLIAGGTIEEKTFNTAVYKTQLSSKVVKGKNTENLALRRMEYLMDPVDPVQSDLTPFAGVDPILDKIIKVHSVGKDCGVRSIRNGDTLEAERAYEWTEADDIEVRVNLQKRQHAKDNRQNAAQMKFGHS